MCDASIVETIISDIITMCQVNQMIIGIFLPSEIEFAEEEYRRGRQGVFHCMHDKGIKDDIIRCIAGSISAYYRNIS